MKENGQTITRRGFLKLTAFTTGAALLSACGPSPIDAQNGNSNQSQPQNVCVDSYPGATVLDILGKNGKDASTPVTVDQGSDGSIDYQGAGVNGPGLQFNEGAKSLDGTQLNETLKDTVCFTK